MCSIFGASLKEITTVARIKKANAILSHIWVYSHQRGRDGRGYKLFPDNVSPHYMRDTSRLEGEWDNGRVPTGPTIIYAQEIVNIIGNTRAEPTTEFVADKRSYDQQPYSIGRWAVVHNGTIANDKELHETNTHHHPSKIDSAVIVELLTNSHDPDVKDFERFRRTISMLKGSFAILASNEENPDCIYFANNYRPIWYINTEVGVFFASAKEFFPAGYNPVMIKPYSIGQCINGKIQYSALNLHVTNRKALVVCSGGLDSVVSAAYAQKELGMEIHLIHFLYGSRAEGPEVQAVKQVAKELECELTLFPLAVYSKGDSPLLDPDAKLAGGEEGAEFASEWVPARNLVLLSVATAFAEARGMETIVLGNNLEEAGAYPDNEPEFINKFNEMLPFGVGANKKMKVIMPVGNMMKHEIVALGNSIGAPMHATWSCYRAGALHCGKCGPCFMRRRAFEINQLPEVINYADEITAENEANKAQDISDFYASRL